MAITKPPVLPAWAESGDKVTPSNAEIQVGWPLSSIPPSRQRFNWLLNFLANGIRYFSRRGLPDYDAAETYMTGDRIIGDDGKTYRSLIDNNTAQTPSAQPSKWEEWAPSLSRLADLLQKQTYTAFTTAGAAPNFTLTPSPAITAYAAGQRFRVKFHAAGTGTDVLNVSTLGNKSLKQYDSTGTKVAAVIAASQLTDVEYDGVDMVIINPLPTSIGVTPPQFDNDTSLATTEFVQRALGNHSGCRLLSASTSLTAADVGKLLIAQGAGSIVVTLPLLSTVPDGAVVEVQSQSANSVSVAPQGPGVITVSNINNALTSIAVGDGESLYLVRVSATKWGAVSGNAALKYAAQFGSSLASAGYQKLPSGLILQWGRVTKDAGSSSKTFTFPIAFPNSCLLVVPIDNASSATVYITAWDAAATTTSGSKFWFSQSALAQDFAYLAIGY